MLSAILPAWVRLVYTNLLYVSVSLHQETLLNLAEALMTMPMMTPNKPSALPKISITRIFTNNVGSCASASAQPLPQIPTQTLRVLRE